MNYFKLSEFACRCGTCGAPVVSQVLLDSLNQLRFLFGKPITITSGYRCAAQNAKAGGEKDSEHLTGEAVDILCDTSQDRWKLLKLAQGIFRRVGVDGRFLHLGVSPSHVQDVVWLYPAKAA